MKKTIALGILLLCQALFTNSYAATIEQASDRITYQVATRGTTVTIPYDVVNQLCGDADGCTLRMGMYNWDGNRRTASRESLFYLDSNGKTWRSSRGDRYGTTNNGKTEHVEHAWACYFTDGSYSNWSNQGDYQYDFGLLSWSQYNTEDCRLTIID